MKLLILFIILLRFLTFPAFVSGDTMEFRAGFVGIGVPLTLDPAFIATTVEFNTALQLFEGLTTFDPKTNETLPGVAERWSVSDNGLVYTFFLRPEAAWSDGVPITAETFRFAWMRVLNPETDAAYAPLLELLANSKAYREGQVHADAVGIRAIGSHTLQVELARPTPFFLNLTALPMYMPVPKHLVEQYGDKWYSREHFTGNGPFLLKKGLGKRNTPDRMVLEKNPHYWGADIMSLQRVTIEFFPQDSRNAMAAYEANALDWLYGFFVSNLETLREHDDMKRFPLLSTYFYRLNVKHPILQDVRVRKALYLALERNYLCREVLIRGELPAFGFVPPRIRGYKNYPGERENHDKARQLLEDAGYPNGEGFPALRIMITDSMNHELIAREVQRMWKEILNINIELEKEKYRVYRKRMYAIDYDITRSSWVGDYIDPSTFLDIFDAPDNPNNRTGWSSPEYSRLLSHARLTTDTKQRFASYARAEEILMNEMPIIPLFHSISHHLIKPYVEGLHPHLMDLHPLKNVIVPRELPRPSQ